ncbi:hypothetical protein NG831_12960 [Xanthomonas sacchari]|uniref:hypothetical protein n=2 Tax=Xanthomonas sacchari TaxID=56458 RepID=UPI002258001E|nr:hypothetical protein [Xanthomonas sacchari]UYK65143.1 hypothetical protein NG831_12960 [Xanthomonas sacchari]
MSCLGFLSAADLICSRDDHLCGLVELSASADNSEISSMQHLSRAGLIAGVLVALLVLVSFAYLKDARAGKVVQCSPQSVEILLAIKSDSEIAEYGATHFKSPNVPFLASQINLSKKLCSDEGRGVRVVYLTAPGFSQSRPFINIDKIYFDDDAAFVEISFPPTGKNADVFLRKRAGVWRVIKKEMWES